MTPPGEEFPFVPREPGGGEASLAPVMPFTLTGSTSQLVHGMLDSGATVNVLPYSVGLLLGAVWDDAHPPVRLTGNLANFEARGLVLSAKVGALPAVQLVFAWTKSDAAPLLLGRVNFFLEFDVCFYRAAECFRFELDSLL